MLLVTRCWLNSVPHSSDAQLYSLLADQLSLLCSLLATRLMVLLASRSSTYAAPGILLLTMCYTSTLWPIVFAEDISCSSFAARCLLYATPFILLTTCYSLLPLCCLLPVYCLVLASRWLDPFFLVARLSSFTARWLNAYFIPLSFTCLQLTARCSLFSGFDALLTNLRSLLVVSF